MTANPDSALRQALVVAKKALAPFVAMAGGLNPVGAEYLPEDLTIPADMRIADLRRAREAHALITEALAQSKAEGE